MVIPDLSRELEGYTIAQLTDTHLDRFSAVMEKGVAAIEAARPDLVAFTGDMVNDPQGLPALVTTLERVKKSGARMVAILGNWEHVYRRTVDELARLYRRFGVELLVNRSITLPNGLVIAGSDDLTNGRPLLDETFRGLPGADHCRLFLTHSPQLLDWHGHKATRFDLVLSGHTHGGQGRLFGWAPLLPPGCGRFLDGFYDTPFGKTFVSRGIGTSILPARFMCRPELPFFTLTRSGRGGEPLTS